MPIRTITKKKALQTKCFYGGRWWIRTTEVIDDRFTVWSNPAEYLKFLGLFP